MTPLLDPYGTDPRGFAPEPPRSLPAGHRPTEPAHDETDPRRRDPIRRAVALRLAVAGRRHVRHRDDLAGVPDRRPGPHAVIFLFRGADPHSAAGPRRDAAITVATRMFLDGPDVQHLPQLLTTITDRARDLDREHGRRGGGLTASELVGYLADRIETPPSANRYWGIAVSSVDTTRERGDNPDPMPWDGLVHLIDGTRMSLHTARPEIPPDIVSTHTLDLTDPMFTLQTWAWAADDTPVATASRRTDLVEAHPALAALHQHMIRTQAGS